jgi:hypothetical protein
MINMRQQTSIEFMIILAVLGALMVFVISTYAKFSAQESPGFSALDNMTTWTQTNYSESVQNPYIDVYMPALSYVNNSNYMYVLLHSSNGSRISYVRPYSQNMLFIPENYSGNASAGQSMFYFTVFPQRAGVNKVNVSVEVYVGNKIYLLNASSTTFSIYNSANGSRKQENATLFASITRHNENVIYNPGNITRIYSVYDSVSCTQLNFWDNPVSIQQQCGDASWQVRINSGVCVAEGTPTLTYCFYKKYQNADIDTIGSSYHSSYNITLNVGVDGTLFNANLTSAKNQSALMNNNAAYGTAIVYGQAVTYSTNIPQDFALLAKQSGLSALQISSYQTFEQYSNNLQSTLNFYNNSIVSSSTLTSINQEVNADNSYITVLMNSTSSNINGCSLTQSSIVCSSTSPFIYNNITARFQKNVFSGNSTIDVGGSTINVG